MRLLFITATRIGDAVLSSGLLAHLLKANPGARVTVAAGAPTAPLFSAVPGLERLLPIEKRSYGLHWLKLWSETVLWPWDLVVDLRASTIGYLLLTRARAVLHRRQSERHRVEELASALQLAEPPAPTVWLAPLHLAAARDLVRAGTPVLALGPAANWGGKQWPAERFAALARDLTGDRGPLAGARVLVMAATHERAQVAPLVDVLAPERTIDLTGKVDLPTAAACLKRAALFVGNDSGLMHLAAAAGTPTLGLFGPSPEWRYRPWGPNTAIVRTPQSYRDLVGAADYDHRSQRTLMAGLTVEMVAEAAGRLLAAYPPRGPA